MAPIPKGSCKDYQDIFLQFLKHKISEYVMKEIEKKNEDF